ncbi:hypothetical protein LCGC14_2862650, partial [marine sediment metagenome]
MPPENGRLISINYYISNTNNIIERTKACNGWMPQIRIVTRLTIT